MNAFYDIYRNYILFDVLEMKFSIFGATRILQECNTIVRIITSMH